MTATHLGGAVIDRPRTTNRSDLAGLLAPYRALSVPRPAPARRIRRLHWLVLGRKARMGR